MYFSELRPDQYHLVVKDETIVRFPLANAVVSGVQVGKIFRNNSGGLFIIHKSGFSLFVAKKNSDHENHFVSFLENSSDIPHYFHIYDPPQFLIDSIEKRKDLFNIRLRKRIQLRYNSLSQEKAVNGNLKIHLVDESNFDNVNELGIDLGNKFWNSRTDFLKNGVGVCVLDEKRKALSICYSACLVDKVAEIDIVTHPEHRKSGFGQLVTHEFIRLSLERKITPSWDCFEDNRASVATARRNNFEITYKYPFISVFIKGKQPLRVI